MRDIPTIQRSIDEWEQERDEVQRRGLALHDELYTAMQTAICADRGSHYFVPDERSGRERCSICGVEREKDK